MSWPGLQAHQRKISGPKRKRPVVTVCLWEPTAVRNVGSWSSTPTLSSLRDELAEQGVRPNSHERRVQRHCGFLARGGAHGCRSAWSRRHYPPCMTATSTFGTDCQLLEHRGCRLAYRVSGDGPNVLFIQGSGLHGDGWRPQVDELSKRYRCLTFDNRGMGGAVSPSVRPSPWSRWRRTHGG